MPWRKVKRADGENVSEWIDDGDKFSGVQPEETPRTEMSQRTKASPKSSEFESYSKELSEFLTKDRMTQGDTPLAIAAPAGGGMAQRTEAPSTGILIKKSDGMSFASRPITQRSEITMSDYMESRTSFSPYKKLSDLINESLSILNPQLRDFKIEATSEGDIRDNLSAPRSQTKINSHFKSREGIAPFLSLRREQFSGGSRKVQEDFSWGNGDASEDAIAPDTKFEDIIKDIDHIEMRQADMSRPDNPSITVSIFKKNPVTIHRRKFRQPDTSQESNKFNATFFTVPGDSGKRRLGQLLNVMIPA